MIEEINICVSPRTAAIESELRTAAATMLGISAEKINDIVITRQSIDARQKNVKVNLTVRIAHGEDTLASVAMKRVVLQKAGRDAEPIVIVGAGPAGLFAALRALELGLRPILLERGKEVDKRILDLAAISRKGVLDPDSNYCFGEGGAGAFSDGKLFTRSKKRGDVGSILQLLVQYGASENILRDAHPHIGSDKLPSIIRNIRNAIIEHGGEVHFGCRVTELIIENDEVKGVKTAAGETFMGPVILATGHSARDVYEMLFKAGVSIEPKGIAMGVRLEHPQELIDRIRYHSPAGRGKWLPPAEYSYVAQVDGRGVYSFCMCPGGVIVPSASAPQESVVNGMSASGRSGKWANSGMVVQILPGDFPEYDKYGPLQMMRLQQDLESKFYEAAGRSMKAPAQRMTDFIEGKASESLPASSYPPGLVRGRLDTLLPPFIAERLKKGFKEFGRKSKGFLTPQALMVGLESRTSSPVRVPRDKETLRHIEMRGLYPCGEGAGYAGGIVSAAIDGRRCVEAYAASLNAK